MQFSLLSARQITKASQGFVENLLGVFERTGHYLKIYSKADIFSV
jgi:hypothetical protein